MKAIANCGPKNPRTSKCSLLNFQRRRAFIVPIPNDGNIILKLSPLMATSSKVVHCAFANPDIKQLPQLELCAPLALRFLILLPINEQGGAGKL
jgi:hypothetical protein